LKPSIQTLGQILYSPSQYVIPVFQRNYRWETANWAKLWDSLIEIRQPDKRGNHFMGFLVFVPGIAQPGQHTTFHLIDGQQRLTTASVLLAVVRNVARRLDQSDLADEVHNDYLTHPRKKGDQHYRLLPKERDHDSYLNLINGKEEPKGRLADAFSYFEERVYELAQADATQLRPLFHTLCQKLEFMCATLEAENAYNIFKSLNSTGVPLGASDLIRNFVFMHVQPEDHDAFDQELWSPLEERFAREDGTLDEDSFSRFFRDYLMSAGRYVSPKDTFSAFETRYEATGFAPRELAQTLLETSRRYAIISGAQADESDAVTRALAGLNALESSTTYPVLLALFEKRAQAVVDAEAFARAVQMLRGFILRRFISGESSRGYGQMFVRALAKEKGDPLAALEEYLLDRGWPDNHQFTTAFVTFPLYERDYKREILETIERARGHKEPASLADAQVEHVMPQTLNDGWRAMLSTNAEVIHKDWLHTPGNLTLSGYNQELWNHDFATKRQRYAQSNVVLTRELSELQRWDEDEIRERGKRLAEEAARIWIGPKESVARTKETEEEDETPARRELRRSFWTGLNDYLATEFPELPDIEPRGNAAIRIASGIRHIGFELYFGLRDSYVGIDVCFWRETSFKLYEQTCAAPERWNKLVDDTWEFYQPSERQRGYMSMWRTVNQIRSEASWLDAYRWFGEKLTLLYERVVPALREEMDRQG
jgi:hypothetical protein